LPSQTPEPVPREHAVPALAGGLLGAPFPQRSFVQAFASNGRSVSSATLVTPPAPSHTFLRQSPAVCDTVGVPEETKEKPHAPGVAFPHARILHSPSVPGQSDAARHCTQVPAPSQSEPP
jgi:hypothetical protein